MEAPPSARLGAHTAHDLDRSSVLQQGLVLTEGKDPGASQEAARELAKEEGLAFVKNAIDRQVPQATDSFAQAMLLTTILVPALRWVTHPRVVDSAVLEQEVSVIFNFMLGIGGRRMVTLFDFITGCIETWPDLNLTELARSEMVELSLNVLSKILECNTANIVNVAFNPLADKFAAFLDGEDDDESYSSLQARRYLDYIKLRLGVGAEIPSAQERRSEPLMREQFVLRRDLPGELSPDGPRHDNDHTDITKIKIMPTAQEITSSRAEYLPTTDSREWHHPGIQGRLDREFRLLREDTVGQLRDTVRGLLDDVRNPAQRVSQQSRNSARTYVYDCPVPREASFKNPSGLEILVEFVQPLLTRNMSLRQRKDWWQHSKRLQEGALVCVFDATGSVLFFEVSESTLRTSEDEPKKRQYQKKRLGDDEQSDDEKKLSLADDAKYGFVSLRLVDSNRHTITQTLRWYRNIGSSMRRYLVEFPGVLLASFKHTLEALQEISRQPKLPFAGLIAPSVNADQPGSINLPQYARKTGFTYNLQSLAADLEPLAIPAQDLRRESALELVSTRTLLDSTQSSAFLDALSRELSLIQGPPGTGKSFTGEKIIKALIANKGKADLGPILCVCYTNHALDQLLEHLLDEGTKDIIRIGSRSKSERIQDLSLRTVAQTVERTKTEKRSLYEFDSEMKSQVSEVTRDLRSLETSSSWRSVKSFLSSNYPNHHQQLFGHMQADEEGWEQVVHKPDRLIATWLNGGDRTDGESRPLGMIRKELLSTMTHKERSLLYRDWLRDIRDPLIRDIVSTEREFAITKTQRDRVRRDVDLRCLQQAGIVGVTTTGLARNLDLLRKLRCKVMVCEEAGEVLEAHILTALLPSVEHAILVGDHLQLRPQIQNYDLQSTNPRGEKHSLDLSLFERLVKPPHEDDVRLPFSVLHTQRRMHPSIAELVRSTLYPHLTDGGKVSSYPEVVGLKKRLFWLHHENLEAGASDSDPTSTSHANSFEIEMTVALVSHLVRQGVYGPDDIAVLTPYLGQLLKLRRRMESMFEISINDRDMEDIEALAEDDNAPSLTQQLQAAKGPSPVAKTTLLKSLRVATVDNFQGEEAKVVVISLVRSNPQNKCGFLNTPNRINVLLSRAKHGMYIIGNANTYSPVPMWSSVINTLQAKGNFGTALELQCPRHPDTPMPVAKADDFLVHAPESGCNEPCNKRSHLKLPCGHTCTMPCAAPCDFVPCSKRCAVILSCGHQCPSTCSEPCPEAKYCQDCGAESVKSTIVDFIEMSEYRDIDLDKDPCIFPDCGHFLMVTSMDGQMNMSAHYYFNPEAGHPVSIKASCQPFSMDEIKVCATCRGPLRNVARYGRIVRRAMLDEATKKFITWSIDRHLRLANRLLSEKGRIETTLEDAKKMPRPSQPAGKAVIAPSHSRIGQLHALSKAAGRNRYDMLTRLWSDISSFAGEVRREEQPFQRVADLVKFANQQHITRGDFVFDDSVLQVKGTTMAAALLLSCEIVVFSDFLELRRGGSTSEEYAEIKLDFDAHLAECLNLLELARRSKLLRQEVEGHIYYAQFCGFARMLCQKSDTAATAQGPAQTLLNTTWASPPQTSNHDVLKEKGLAHAAEASAVIAAHPSSLADLAAQVEAAENTLRDGVFYQAVSTEEMRAVYAAMAGSFRGTGHWYTCENRHPFTVGECGMPMEQVRCPECDAPIGGRDHRPAEGVRRAAEMDELAGGVGEMNL
ncbi:p-loop containing nucleoside triphosphate hydrolase protein [Coniochaeta hoffmannii]|uniref:P-loop containing nucleoside triphosphate hydrolase protein n=1 Tax=Coniochaeta hoffmannii TaxID=91930 RepID=A0AA38R1R1_9PEZI|nr:p-loop containing nucleoside triphosphate hydrolase protein [Coniochaeta hoffmannii]